MGWGSCRAPKGCLHPPGLAQGFPPSAFPGRDGDTQMRFRVTFPGWREICRVRCSSRFSGFPAPSSVPHGAAPGVAQRQCGHLGDTMADGHGMRGWSRIVQDGCSPEEVARHCPLCFKLVFPCDSLGTLQQCWMGSASTCFGLYQHKGWHENNVLSMRPF